MVVYYVTVLWRTSFEMLYLGVLKDISGGSVDALSVTESIQYGLLRMVVLMRSCLIIKGYRYSFLICYETGITALLALLVTSRMIDNRISFTSTTSLARGEV